MGRSLRRTTAATDSDVAAVVERSEERSAGGLSHCLQQKILLKKREGGIKEGDEPQIPFENPMLDDSTVSSDAQRLTSDPPPHRSRPHHVDWIEAARQFKRHQK